MSIVDSRPERPPVSYSPIPYQRHPAQYYKDYTVNVQSIPARTSSVSPVKPNYYSVYNAPTIYSPTSPTVSYFSFDAPASPRIPASPIFKRLPQRVSDAILNQLELSHTVSPHGCTTCFQRDLHSLSLTSRFWERAVRAKLYNRIHIIGSDSPSQLKKYRLKQGSRLKLLRRTLRERKLLANLVLELRVPQLDLLITNGKPSAQWEEYRDLVASVVIVCPNLERLLGFSIPFNHEFDRLTHALSTRKRLKEHTWVLSEASQDVEVSPRSSSCPSSLGPLQMFEFLEYHTSWTNLESLMLHALNNSSSLEPSIFLRMFNLLPSLRHLCVSSFDADAFADSTLICLPPLTSLRLENLPGVTDAGLIQYTSSPEARALKSLTLIEQNIKSLLVISKIFASLTQLKRFSIVQTSQCPSIPSDDIVFQPILASASLEWLHWDIASPDAAAALSKLESAPFLKPPRHIDTPNSHLAQSILAAGFPQLKAIRAPSDIEPPGALQAVCRPIPNGQALMQPDRYSLPRSSHGSVSTRPLALPAGNNLTSARIRAQTFIDMAAKDAETGMKVVIQDYSDDYVPDSALDDFSSDESEMEAEDCQPSAMLVESKLVVPPRDPEGPTTVYEFRMPAYMGRIGVQDPVTNVPIPRFILRPDIPGADMDGGLVGWKHLLNSHQSLTYAAGVGANSSIGRGSASPPVDQEPISPASSASRFAWGSRSSIATSPISIPLTPSSASSPSTLPWEKDTCIGSWNHSHRHGKDWWYHVERDRSGNADLVLPKQFFNLGSC